MFEYKQKYYDLLEELAELVKENRDLRKAYNRLSEELKRQNKIHASEMEEHGD